MKTLNQTAALYLLVLLSLITKSQVLNENFNSGLPASWTQFPASSWTQSPTLGISGSGCAFTQEVGSTTMTTTYRTPTLNLSSVAHLTVSFKIALIGNNFIVPNVALSYDAGSGLQFLARWGSGFSSNTTYTVTTFGYDYQPPLDPEHVNFVSCTQTVSAISGTMASFIFDAEMINGGYVVLEDLAITGITTATTGLHANKQASSVVIFPNPTSNKKLQVEGSEIKTMLITDEAGKISGVNYSKISEGIFEVDLSKLANGIYYLSAQTEDEVMIRKKIVVE